jgi:hypothetical protein
MTPQYPMSTVPNLQGFPEAGYPASAFYGINSTLAAMNGMGASSSATASGGNLSVLAEPVQQPTMRTLVVALTLVVGGVFLWHTYMS